MFIKTLSAERVIEIHDDVLHESGGLFGICPDKSLEGALQRIDNHILYEGLDDIFVIAALYAIALAQGHIFNDGNKRTALISMIDCLDLNGYELIVDQNEAVEIMVQIAEKKLSREQIAAWLKNHSN